MVTDKKRYEKENKKSIRWDWHEVVCQHTRWCKTLVMLENEDWAHADWAVHILAYASNNGKNQDMLYMNTHIQS